MNLARWSRSRTERAHPGRSSFASSETRNRKYSAASLLPLLLRRRREEERSGLRFRSWAAPLPARASQGEGDAPDLVSRWEDSWEASIRFGARIGTMNRTGQDRVAYNRNETELDAMA